MRALLLLLLVALLLLAVLVLGSDAYADETEAQIEATLFAWKLVVLDHTGDAYQRGGDLFGGRAIGTIPLQAGLHLGLRGDASALSAAFDVSDPGTYGTVRSLEGYVALSRPFALGPLTAGPALMGGALVPVSTETTWASRPTWGAGARLGHGRSWAYLLAGKNGAADERAPGAEPLRFLAAVHVEVVSRFALVADIVTGQGGFARGGIAWRIPIPWGIERGAQP